jgi:hypothetical protein
MRPERTQSQYVEDPQSRERRSDGDASKSFEHPRGDELRSWNSGVTGQSPGGVQQPIQQISPPSSRTKHSPHQIYDDYGSLPLQTVPSQSLEMMPGDKGSTLRSSSLDIAVQEQGLRKAPSVRRSKSPNESVASIDRDAMGDVDSWGLRVGLLGTSSSASFMKQIQTAVDGRETLDGGHGTKGARSSHVSTRTLRRTPVRKITSHSADYVLPPRKTADRLMTIHWNYSHVIFPWLDRLQIMKCYEDLWTGNEDPDPYMDTQVFYGILNTIFAISYKLDPEVQPNEQEELSVVYFARAQKLLSFNILSIGLFELIPALLTGQYLQSTNMPRECFQSIGLAIWIAQDMGLHLPDTTSSVEGQHEREMARRVWYGCILMDRVASMTFGRPTRISQETATLAPPPTAMDDEYFNELGTGIQPAGEPSRLDFFLQYCGLHNILGDILETFYTLPASANNHSKFEYVRLENSPVTQDVNKLLEFDKALNEWRDNLEPHLEVSSEYRDVTDALVFKRQAIILYARFLHIRILLFRPFLSEASRSIRCHLDDGISSPGPLLAESITARCLVSCTKAAQQLIELIANHTRPSGNQLLLPPWWHFISYVYIAATVVIAAHLFPAVTEKVTISELTASKQRAFNVLQHYADSRKPAQRCRSALEALYDKVILPRTRVQSPNGNLDQHFDPNAQYASSGIALPADSTQDAGFANLFDATDMLWLNSASFDPDYNFGL